MGTGIIYVAAIVFGALCSVPLVTKIVIRQYFEEKQQFLLRLQKLTEMPVHQQIH